MNNILNDLGVGVNPPSQILQKIAEFEEFYNNSELTDIYTFLLLNIKNYEILSGIIKYADMHKSAKILSVLLDIMLLRCMPYEDSDELVNLRVLCTKAISNYKDNSTVIHLLHCLNNKNENYKLRLACADALGRIGDRYAVAPLIDVVKDEEEKSVYVKESAVFALGLLGDTGAIDPLVTIMEAKQGVIDKFSFLKEKIVEALGKLSLNSSRVLHVYKTALMDSSPMVRINTIEALMNSEYEEATELIRTALKDEEEEVQRNALIALYNMVGRDILDEVLSLPSYSEFLKNEAKNLIDEYEEE